MSLGIIPTADLSVNSDELQSAVLPPILNRGVSADRVDYTFPIKMAWRDLWGKFLERTVPIELRQHLKILCLPSAQVEPEVSLYLRLGFRPENITGVEGGDSEARAKFLLRAREFGINPILGRLEDVVHDFSSPFDIVSYDFIGPFSKGAEEILYNTPISETAWVLTNFLGAREPRSAQKIIRSAAATDRREKGSVQGVLKGVVTESFAKEMEAWSELNSISDAEQADLKELREDWIEQQAISALGKGTSHYRTPRIEFLAKHGYEIDPHVLASSSGEDTTAQIASLLTQFIIAGSGGSSPAGVDLTFNVIYRALVAFSLRSHGEIMERYSYRSQASEKGSWFFSQFVKLSPFNSFSLLTDRSVAPLFADLVEATLPSERNSHLNLELQLRDRRGTIMQPRFAAKNHEITLLRDGRRSSSVRVGQLADWLEKLKKDGDKFTGYSSIPERVQITI